MTIDKSTTAEHGAAARRGEDTHWWTAYRLHSTAAAATVASTKRLSPQLVSPSRVDQALLRATEAETETKIQLAIDDVLDVRQRPASGAP